MRFLLFPRRTKRVLSDSSAVITSRHSQGPTSRRREGLIVSQQKSISPTQTLTTTGQVVVSKSSSSSSTKIDSSSKTLWGQQCNENCGCIVRFNATVDTKTNTIGSIDYTAKSLFIVKDPTSGRAVIAKTSKGRPLLKDCSCTTVHSLSKTIVQEIQNRPNWDKLYSDLCNFETNRSSTAFRQAVLYAQNLPSTDTTCFDVVEEAITAMVKGYMPSTRNNNIVIATHQRKLNTIQRYTSSIDDDVDDDDIDDNDYYNNMKNIQSHTFYGSNSSSSTTALPFGHIFEELSKPSMLSLSSTLRMYDNNLRIQQQQEKEQEQNRQRSNRQSLMPLNSNTGTASGTNIRDWVSYVDYQYQEDEKSSA